MAKSKKPTDVKAFWVAPHCGPGTTDQTKECGYCGRSYADCAKEFTEFLEKATQEDLEDYNLSMWGYPDALEERDNHPCGGSGFWCYKCGRFWAQNICGENSGAEHEACDGARLTIDPQGNVYCVCGQHLMIHTSKDPEGEGRE